MYGEKAASQQVGLGPFASRYEDPLGDTYVATGSSENYRRACKLCSRLVFPIYWRPIKFSRVYISRGWIDPELTAHLILISSECNFK